MNHKDLHGRPLRNLRLSVTDRCNLRCSYCMPEESYTWLPQGDILSFEEMARLVDVFCDLGVDRVRLTGGEPLLRKDVHELVAMLAKKPRLRDLAMTTNGVLLPLKVDALKAAGLHRVTVSLDTLDPGTFKMLARRDDLERVLEGIRATHRVFGGLKIDTVVMRGVNDQELRGLLEFGKRYGAEVRFIEYMDVGGATRWSPDRVVSRSEILERLPAATAVLKTDSAPADRFRMDDGTMFGIISSTTAPFCGSCDRTRVTADGRWFNCLYDRNGENLLELLRGSVDDDGLRTHIASVWRRRDARGAEERLALHRRTPLAMGDELRDNPHLEMHTRGG